ncbi:hypothetical protein [Sphingomonas turrisvirgatae]|uniref:DUF4760 domain-containing protein n=1 Tax=Sphingomonas turrisvirgatae TaxID=1888892 RepID=A0A1E3LR07_9SPHN|nr:hypothetical protein [Sphingomonas turrisvirgatae]ODP36191.1 hypothetical protein BFL28_07220 [Sphingomonas turrisvirgatae]
MTYSYSLLDIITLDAGSWADWFSGVASGLAVIVALSAYPIAKRQRRAEQHERDQEIGRAVGWKLLRVLNHTADINRHIQSGLSSQTQHAPPGFKFPLVRPLGLPERAVLELNQSEIDFLLKAKSAELLMEIDMCVGRYQSIAYSMGEYKLRHEALFELMPPPVANGGTIFSHRLSKEEAARVRPYSIMLDALLDGIIELTRENLARAVAAIKLYNKDMERHFGKPLMDFETDEELAPELVGARQ